MFSTKKKNKKRNVLTIAAKLKIINQLEMTTCVLHMVHFIPKLHFVRLSKNISYSKHSWSQLVWIVGILLYLQSNNFLNIQHVQQDFFLIFLF